MVATYSPHGDVGGTLHFPSPTHIRHVDASSAFRQLRRSLSRSPSKSPAFRLVTSKSASPSPRSPLSPPHEHAPNQSVSASLLHANVAQSSPLAVPYPPSIRKNMSASRRLSPLRVSSRSRSSHRSPGRTTLSDSSDNGNATPRSSAGSSDDVENRINRHISPDGDSKTENLTKVNAIGSSNTMVPPPRGLAKFEKSNAKLDSFPVKSSPLKRSDGIMNLDPANLGSPSAKRRSVHGATFGPDFDIFDYEAAFQGLSDPRTSDGLNKDFIRSQEHSNIASPLPRRTSSLRRTTLQQRHDKPSVVKSRFNSDVAHDFSTPGQAAPKSRFRMSLDNFLPSMARDSPFSSQGNLPNASVHPVPPQSTQICHHAHYDKPQRHPLSRTLTQSSSNSSMAEDSPTHIPHRQPEQRRTFVDFSKSLPIGAARPGSREAMLANLSSQAPSTEASFSTPENYKLAKPLPAAFMSTGLISKRHKDIEDIQPGFQGGKSIMPDTPCKRHSLMGGSPPVPAPDGAVGKPRHVRHSFGTPSTPFNPHPSRPAPGTFGKGVSIFGSNFNGASINRRGSFLSVDGDDHLQSPSAKINSQSSNEYDLPPTPTKQVLASGGIHIGVMVEILTEQKPQRDHSEVLDNSRPQSSELNQSCKLIPFETPSGSVDGDSDNMMDESPTVALKSRSHSLVPFPPFSSGTNRSFKSHVPLLLKSCTLPFPHSKKPQAKTSPLSPASPVPDRPMRMSPHTPREGMIPPDPSGLSISARAEGRSSQPVYDLTSSASIYPPATPTASRDFFPSFGHGKLSLNSSHNAALVDVDPTLTSKFDKVELIGTGEFSHVYRVTQTQVPNASHNYFSLQTNHGSPKTSMPDRVWAVKKSRHAYIGPKDRQRKLQEVKALRALAQGDHTVHFFDSWEEKSHLYIQTEFCEEGSLDLFLDQVGRKARLDDFRIWKILLELSLVSDIVIWPMNINLITLTGPEAYP